MADYRKANEYVRGNVGGKCNYPDLWDLGRFAMIQSDAVATKMLDMAEMFGVHESIRMLQNVLNEPLEDHEERHAVDGIMKKTVADAISTECKHKGGEYALLAALVSSCEERLTATPGLPNMESKLKRAEMLP